MPSWPAITGSACHDPTALPPSPKIDPKNPRLADPVVNFPFLRMYTLSSMPGHAPSQNERLSLCIRPAAILSTSAFALALSIFLRGRDPVPPSMLGRSHSLAASFHTFGRSFWSSNARTAFSAVFAIFLAAAYSPSSSASLSLEYSSPLKYMRPAGNSTSPRAIASGNSRSSSSSVPSSFHDPGLTGNSFAAVTLDPSMKSVKNTVGSNGRRRFGGVTSTVTFRGRIRAPGVPSPTDRVRRHVANGEAELADAMAAATGGV
mmetsp:Transcript_42030/g.82430  ORF Transcript_42030/g.82430 Transcript_42030/m.82430 type:complete len:261 (+) Transcript_42030:171-953(+)